jgi:hypothetical protein
MSRELYSKKETGPVEVGNCNFCHYDLFVKMSKDTRITNGFGSAIIKYNCCEICAEVYNNILSDKNKPSRYNCEFCEVEYDLKILNGHIVCKYCCDIYDKFAN